MNAVAALALILLAPPVTPDVKDCVRRGLDWLAGQQKDDGAWYGDVQAMPTFSTSYAGLALLMEGSTLKGGRYAPNIRKAVAYLEKNTAPSGRLGGSDTSEAYADLSAHAAALVFLVSVYDADDDEDRRERLGKQIKRALSFCATTQTDAGGWGYSSVVDQNSPDAYSTSVMLQAVLAARRAGFDVHERVTERAVRFLVKCTRGDGGVAYGPVTPDNDQSQSDPDVFLTASAAVGLLMSDGPRPEVLARWVDAAKANASPLRQNLATNPIALTQQLYLARLAFSLGESGHRRLDPKTRGNDLLTWSGYRRVAFASLTAAQRDDGGWPAVFYGRTNSTAFVLIILQLQNGYLPAFSR